MIDCTCLARLLQSFKRVQSSICLKMLSISIFCSDVKVMFALVEAQADITIAELRDKIYAEKGVAISWTLTQNWVKRLGLRLKKSRSTPSSETLKPTVENVPSFISAS